MTWSSFSLLVGICYSVYYGFNILLDLLKPSKTGTSDETETLTITESHEPTVISEFEDDVIEPLEPVNEIGVINESDNTLRKEEISETTTIDDDDVIVSKEVQTILPSPLSGGVEYLDFIKLCRQKALVEASKHDFA